MSQNKAIVYLMQMTFIKSVCFLFFLFQKNKVKVLQTFNQRILLMLSQVIPECLFDLVLLPISVPAAVFMLSGHRNQRE